MAFITSSPSHTKNLLEAVRRAMGPRAVKEQVPSTDDITGFSLLDIRQQVSIPIPEESRDCTEKEQLHKNCLSSGPSG